MRQLLVPIALAVAFAVPAVAQDTGPVTPVEASAPSFSVVLRAPDDTLPLRVRDDHGRMVDLRIPRSLHRDANRFRLYGTRPLTLWSHSRRRDLYRDAFLELATQANLTRPTTAWDSASQQWEWLRSMSPELQQASNNLQLPAAFRDGVEQPLRSTGQALKELAAKPGYPQLAAALKALAGADFKPEGVEPMTDAIQLRALATDQADRRLALLGDALRVNGPNVDPALRDGYRAAREEFDQVRSGLWSALALSMKKNQGRLMLSAARQIVLSRLGWWAIFGHLAWQGVESNLNAEYGGQYAICLATVASGVAEACGRVPEPGGPEPLVAYLPLALYAEFALNYQLTEAHKTGQLLGLKPAGGRSTATWQLSFSQRCSELRTALSPTLTAAGGTR